MKHTYNKLFVYYIGFFLTFNVSMFEKNLDFYIYGLV